MKLFSRHILTLVACLAGIPVASAQSAVGDTFCALYRQAAQDGKAAFTALRGEEMEGERWRLKDVTIEGGACSVRANAKKHTDTVMCLFKSDSAEAAKKWVDDMAAAARTCLSGLDGFVEQAAGNDDDGKERVGWMRKSDTGTLRISLSAVEKDGRSQTRMIMRHGGDS
jgi:hypothetical protein